MSSVIYPVNLNRWTSFFSMGERSRQYFLFTKTDVPSIKRCGRGVNSKICCWNDFTYHTWFCISLEPYLYVFVAEEFRKPDRRRIWWQEEAPTGKEGPRETDSGAQF